MAKIPHVLVLPYPAQGHVLPMMEFSLNLVQHGIKTTFVNSDFNHARVVKALAEAGHSVHDGMRLVSIPDGMEPDDDRNDLGKLTPLMSVVMKRKLEELISEINASYGDEITCIVSDFTTGWVLQVADKMKIKKAVFSPAAAGTLAWVLSIPKLLDDGILDEVGSASKTDMIKLSPEMPALKSENICWTVFDSKETQKAVFEVFRKYNKFLHSADWLICNSTYDLEPAAFNLFPKIRSVGPLLASNRRGRSAGSFWTEDSSCLKWLDQQPPSSVIYVAFGSLTVFNKSQFQELAKGLELTNRRFLWVVRSDITEQTEEAYPNGFMARVADRGRMVGWAPQQQVLSHPAIACFVSHCGWNSTMEGVCNGLPFLCWPYFADQMFNENYVCDVWRIGLRFEKDVNGIISKDEIVAKVEKILCDRGFKARAILVKDKTLSSIKDEGSSFKNIKDFIQWTKA